MKPKRERKKPIEVAYFRLLVSGIGPVPPPEMRLCLCWSEPEQILRWHRPYHYHFKFGDGMKKHVVMEPKKKNHRLQSSVSKVAGRRDRSNAVIIVYHFKDHI